MKLPELEAKRTCCFAGYRPHKFGFAFNKYEIKYKQLISNIESAIIKSYEDGYRNFLCGGAIGFDILCGEAVVKLKPKLPDLKLICILPFEKQAKNFPKTWYDRYMSLLEACDFIDYMSPKYVAGCYYARSEKMIDLSSKLITFFDGKGGGTARTIAYAQLNKLEIINLCEDHPIPENITFFTGRKRRNAEKKEQIK